MLDDLRRDFDVYAAYLRDCVIKGDMVGVVKAELNLKKLDVDLWLEYGELL